jgi:hypothetical protein
LKPARLNPQRFQLGLQQYQFRLRRLKPCLRFCQDHFQFGQLLLRYPVVGACRKAEQQEKQERQQSPIVHISFPFDHFQDFKKFAIFPAYYKQRAEYNSRVKTVFRWLDCKGNECGNGKQTFDRNQLDKQLMEPLE